MNFESLWWLWLILAFGFLALAVNQGFMELRRLRLRFKDMSKEEFKVYGFIYFSWFVYLWITLAIIFIIMFVISLIFNL